MSRAVLITGASRGIGRATARAFAAGGDRVAVHHRDSADLAAQAVAELAGSGHVVVRGDVGDPVAVQAFVDEAASHLGGLDVVVNNEAVFPPHPIADMGYEDWQRAWRHTVDVNLLGPANVI